MEMASRYTEEEIEFVKDNLNSFESFAELAKELNRKFNTNRSREAIRSLVNKRLTLKLGKNRSTFKPGSRTRELPIGTIRIGKNGAKYIKVSNTLSKFSGYRLPDWVPVQRKVWEDAHGPIKKGEMIVFLTTDRDNISVDNLVCIDRKVAAILNKNRWHFEERDLALAAVYLAKLIIANRSSGGGKLEAHNPLPQNQKSPVGMGKDIRPQCLLGGQALVKAQGGCRVLAHAGSGGTQAAGGQTDGGRAVCGADPVE